MSKPTLPQYMPAELELIQDVLNYGLKDYLVEDRIDHTKYMCWVLDDQFREGLISRASCALVKSACVRLVHHLQLHYLGSITTDALLIAADRVAGVGMWQESVPKEVAQEYKPKLVKIWSNYAYYYYRSPKRIMRTLGLAVKTND